MRKLLAGEHSNCYDFILRLLGLPDLLGKAFLITVILNSPKLIFERFVPRAM